MAVEKSWACRDLLFWVMQVYLTYGFFALVLAVFVPSCGADYARTQSNDAMNHLLDKAEQEGFLRAEDQGLLLRADTPAKMLDQMNDFYALKQ